MRFRQGARHDHVYPRVMTADDPDRIAREAYDAGHLAGRIDARLADHDRHLAAINGSTARVASELTEIRLAFADMRTAMQRLADSADADRRTVVTTAAALKDAEDARRAVGSDRWSPWQRLAVVLGTLAAVAGVVAAILTR